MEGCLSIQVCMLSSPFFTLSHVQISSVWKEQKAPINISLKNKLFSAGQADF